MNLNTNTSMIQEIQNIEPPEIPKHFNDIILKNFCNHKIIYTDGSKSNVKTGLAIITDEETFKFSSLEINSIFTIEALAILKAIELTEQNWKNTKSFLIASDSLSSILAIQNQGTSNEIIKNIQERASSLAPRSVTFMWISAHKNIPGNEKADVAAKEAASTNINIPKLDLSSFKDTARNSLINSKKIHQRLWDQELNNKLHQIKPFLSLNPNPPSSTRRQQVIWTRMKIGHTNISHVHLMRRESRPNCKFCNNAPISTAHLLLECSNLSEQRKIFPHLTLRDILIIHIDIMHNITQFISPPFLSTLVHILPVYEIMCPSSIVTNTTNQNLIKFIIKINYGGLSIFESSCLKLNFPAYK
ncbi:hypothetical protein AGLY_006662 [Aphis glycines]|uniref:RNase H type-1 domain-containing protein n=1 Tax=Aphis glycines TaxID=307491 RepID=A0A6G0TSL5_APHGL|nr:hypothetical protein AGLY_006662 [Aphis glycines]